MSTGEQLGELLPEGRWVSPWGDEAPPSPPGLDAEQDRCGAQRVALAWRCWGSRRPSYCRTGETVTAEIELKGPVFRGQAAHPHPEVAAWHALQNLYVNYSTDPGVLRAVSGGRQRGRSKRPQ